MRQSTTAPPPRSWSKTEGYDREQRDFSSTNAESSSHTVQNQNSTNGPLLRRSASVGSNDDQDNAPVGIDTRQPREPLSLPQSIDFVWQNLNMTEQDLLTFATKPADINVRFTCRIQRHREGIDRLNPRYDLYLQNLATNEVQWLLTAIKKRQSQTSYYSIFGSAHDNRVPVDHQQERTKQIKIGKVR
ncbi:hypothetical protein VKS41_001560 [Umbelopsis sp. WA50703]